MLTIVVGEEGYNDEKNEFFIIDPVVLELEHSLISLSKWESIYKKPFLSDTPLTMEESIEYFKCMTLTPNIAPEVYDRLSDENIEQINEYMDDKQTATWFRNVKNPGNRDVITAEVIYHWLITFKIPFEVQHWHLNRLITLVRVCGEKSKQPKKMSKHEILERNRSLNEERKARLGTTG